MSELRYCVRCARSEFADGYCPSCDLGGAPLPADHPNWHRLSAQALEEWCPPPHQRGPVVTKADLVRAARTMDVRPGVADALRAAQRAAQVDALKANIAEAQRKMAEPRWLMPNRQSSYSDGSNAGDLTAKDFAFCPGLCGRMYSKFFLDAFGCCGRCQPYVPDVTEWDLLPDERTGR